MVKDDLDDMIRRSSALLTAAEVNQQIRLLISQSRKRRSRGPLFAIEDIAFHPKEGSPGIGRYALYYRPLYAADLSGDRKRIQQGMGLRVSRLILPLMYLMGLQKRDVLDGCVFSKPGEAYLLYLPYDVHTAARVSPGRQPADLRRPVVLPIVLRVAEFLATVTLADLQQWEQAGETFGIPLTGWDIHRQVLHELTGKPEAELADLLDGAPPAVRQQLDLDKPLTDADARQLFKQLRATGPALVGRMLQSIGGAMPTEITNAAWVDILLTRLYQQGVYEHLAGLAVWVLVENQGTESEVHQIHLFEQVTDWHRARQNSGRAGSGFQLNLTDIVGLLDRDPAVPQLTFDVPVSANPPFSGPCVRIDGIYQKHAIRLYLYACPPVGERPRMSINVEPEPQEIPLDEEPWDLTLCDGRPG